MNRHPVKTAIIGVGRWGQNVAHELGALSDLAGYVIRDNPEHAAWVAAHLPTTRRLSRNEVAADTSITAVAIATPIDTHAALARQMLEAYKHVFVEKPLATSSEEAEALAELARERGCTLMTGYIFLYHPLYRELKELAQAPITRVECVWKKFGTFEEDIEMNLLTHHLALALDLLGMPETGSLKKGEGIESGCDRLEVQLAYPGAAFISRIDRASEEKAHTIQVELADGTSLLWDGTELSKDGILVLRDDHSPLARELDQFLVAVQGGPVSVTSGDFGARVLRIHELLKGA